MKKLLLSLILFTGLLSAYSQVTFERTYDFWNLGEVNEIYQDNEGYTMAGGGKHGELSYLFVLRIDLDGDTVWLKEFDFGVNYNFVWIRAAVTDEAGNRYFALTQVGDSANFVKFDSQWNLVWKKRLDNNYFIRKMGLAHDGNILAVGQDQSYSYYMTKLNQDGIIQWRTDDIPYNAFGNLQFSSIMELPDNKIVLTSNWQNNTYFVNTASEIRTYSAEGDSLSGVYMNSASIANTIYQSELVGDEIISLTQKPNDYNTTYLIRHKADGTILMEKELCKEARIYQFILKDNSTIIGCGTKFIPDHSFIYLAGYSINGDSLWSSNPGNSDEKTILSMKVCDDGGMVLAGVVGNYMWTGALPYVLKTDSLGKLTPVGLPEIKEDLVKVYPNPATTSVVFETPGIQSGNIIIFDVTGKQCDAVAVHSDRTLYSTKNLEEGVYFYTLTGSKQSSNGKFIIKR